MFTQPILPRFQLGLTAMTDCDDRDVHRTWEALAHLETVYPGFRRWYWQRVVPGLENGTRRLFLTGCKDAINGIAIAKRERSERKICTVWVAPDRRQSGVGSELVDRAIDWLDDTHPLLTVPEERISEFLKLVDSRGFVITQALPSYYRTNRIEYVFNGSLQTEQDA